MTTALNQVPGVNEITDIVSITNGTNPVISSGTRTIGVMNISNASGSTINTGSTLTINSGAILNVQGSASNLVSLFGGNIVNNGTLNITSTAVGFTSFPATGINFRTPTRPPVSTAPATYSYSGTGILNIALNAADFDTSVVPGAITITSNNAFTTYNMLVNNTNITLNQNTTKAIAAIRAVGTSGLASTLFITGASGMPAVSGGLTVGSVAIPSKGSLISMASAARVTIDTNTVLTFNSDVANTNSLLQLGNSTSVGNTIFTNNGTLNLLGPTSANGIKITTFSAAGNPSISTNLVNNGTLNVDINANSAANSNEGPAAFASTNGYGQSNINALLTFTNNGTLNLKNSAVNTGIGQPIWVSTAGQRTVTVFDNIGTVNLEGTASNVGASGFTINNNNNGIINSNSAFGSFTAISNVSSGTINFTSSSNQTNAIVSPTTNSGTINTGAASDLGVVSGISTASTGIIDPGGSSRRGIADLSTGSTLAINSTLRLQIAANGTAGVNFDRITNSAIGGGFDITNAKLDIASIYTPIANTTIDIITTNATGTLSGSNFNQIVTPVPSGWAVNVINGTNGSGKVQLDYSTVTRWNGSFWSHGVPTIALDAEINGSYSTATNGAIIARNLTVNATTGNLTINSGTNVTVQNAVVNNGTLTIQNNANLIQVNNVANTGSGTTTVNRNGSTLKRLDYTLWSSPVAPNQTLKAFSNLTVDPRFYEYLESTNKYRVIEFPSSTTFETGKGYLIRMPDQYPANSGNGTLYYALESTLAYPGSFVGVLNNGDIPFTLIKTDEFTGYQAVGNPYPSVIKAQDFVNANSARIENTLYFWRKTNGAAGSAYATWTAGGATTNESGVEEPNGKIQVGQGFIVRAKDSRTVTNFFTNTMREEAPSSTQFFRTKQQAQKDRLWLNLTNTSGAFSQALVAYIADATVGLDKYDGKYINDSGIALTTSIAGDEYTIQGRPAFNATDVVALNFKTSVAGTYTIAIDHVDGLFSNGQAIYLVDKKLGVTTNLNEGAYGFTAEAGVDNTRFELTYQKTLKVDAPLFNENSVFVSRNNGTLNVKSAAVAINNVKVFDVQGRLVAERKNVKSNSASFSNLKANQVLIVKVTSENNDVVTKKVLN